MAMAVITKLAREDNEVNEEAEGNTKEKALEYCMCAWGTTIYSDPSDESDALFTTRLLY